MCDVPNDFHVHLSPLCSWLWPGAGCSRLPGLRLRHCLTGEVCCARRCHDVCCFLQILISWVSWVSFEVSCCFFIVSWRFLFAKKLQSFGVPCWACQYLGPLHLRAFLSIPADSALPATLFLKDVSSQLATGTEQSSKVKHAYLISQIWSTPKKLHHFRLCYRKIIQLCSENKNWGGLLGSLHHGSKYRGLKCGRQKGPKGATTIHQEVWPNEGIGMFNVWQHVQYVEYLGCNRLKMFCLKHLAWLTHVWTPWRLGTFSV